MQKAKFFCIFHQVACSKLAGHLPSSLNKIIYIKQH